MFLFLRMCKKFDIVVSTHLTIQFYLLFYLLWCLSVDSLTNPIPFIFLPTNTTQLITLLRKTMTFIYTNNLIGMTGRLVNGLMGTDDGLEGVREPRE